MKTRFQFFLFLATTLLATACGRDFGKGKSDDKEPPRPPFEEPFGAERIRIHGNYAVVTSQAGFSVFDISVPTDPRRIATVRSGFANDSVVVGNRLFVANWGEGLLAFDVSDWSNPKKVLQLPVAGVASAVRLQGTKLYVGGNLAGLSIVDIASPDAPVVLGGIDTEGQMEDLAVQGNYVFAPVTFEGLLVYDVSDPRNPVKVGVGRSGFPESSMSWRIDLHGDTAVVTDTFGGLELFDISNPTLPKSITRLGPRLRDVAVIGDLAVASQGPEIIIHDISKRGTISVVSRLTLMNKETDHVLGIEIRGNLAYVCASTQLVVVDIADPRNPIVVSRTVM